MLRLVDYNLSSIDIYNDLDLFGGPTFNLKETTLITIITPNTDKIFIITNLLEHSRIYILK